MKDARRQKGTARVISNMVKPRLNRRIYGAEYSYLIYLTLSIRFPRLASLKEGSLEQPVNH